LGCYSEDSAPPRSCLAVLGFGIAAFLAQGNRRDVMITSALPAFLNVRYGVCALLDFEHFISSDEFFSSSKIFVGAVNCFYSYISPQYYNDSEEVALDHLMPTALCLN
jgi:hypothetical protein